MSSIFFVFLTKEIRDSVGGAEIAEASVKTGHCKTLSEARRAIKQGAIRVADIKIIDPFARLVYNKDDNTFFVVQTRE